MTIKNWLAGAAAFAMMTGVATAQSSSSSTSTTTSSSPAAGTYNSTTTERSMDSTGTQIDKVQTYSSEPSGTKSSSTVRSEELTVIPGDMSTTTTKKTTTTIDR